jgi:hypothetical protein
LTERRRSQERLGIDSEFCDLLQRTKALGREENTRCCRCVGALMKRLRNPAEGRSHRIHARNQKPRE